MHRSLKVIIRVSDRCNQDCKYCYVSRDARQTAGNVLNIARLRPFCEDILSGQLFHHVSVVWHGGEPTLLGTKILGAFIGMMREVKADGVTLEHAIQTNATALTDEMTDLLLREKVGVGVSLDAPREAHDQMRVFWDGRSTFTRTIRGIRMLKEAGIQFGAICVLHRLNVKKAREIYSFFKDLGIGYSLNPFYSSEEVDCVTARDLAVTSEQYAEALLDTLDAYVGDRNPTIHVGDLKDITLSMMVGKSENCLFLGRCNEFVGISSDGKVYACDNFGSSDGLIGQLDNTSGRAILASRVVRHLSQRQKVLRHGFCRECSWWNVCKGGCSSKAQAVFGDLHREDPFCSARKAVFERISQILHSEKEAVL